MINVGKRFKNVIIDKRDYHASDECPTNEYFNYIGKLCKTTNFFYICVTSPFFTCSDYEEIIQTYKTLKFQNLYDSITPSKEIKDFVFHEGKSIGFDVNNLPKSQNINNLIDISMSCSLLPTEYLVNKKSILGYKPYFKIIKDSIKMLDINFPSEFVICELLYKNGIESDRDIII